MTCCLPLTGCLVTDPVEFEQEENFPASIESRASDAPHPLNEVIIVDLEEPDALEGDLEFEVSVRDPNVQQDLTFLVFLDNSDDTEAGGPILADGSPSRQVTFTVRRMRFSEPGCRRIDMLVSEDFQSFSPRTPRRQPEEGELQDLGTAHWWVFTRLGPEDEVNPSECPGRPM